MKDFRASLTALLLLASASVASPRESTGEIDVLVSGVVDCPLSEGRCLRLAVSNRSNNVVSFPTEGRWKPEIIERDYGYEILSNGSWQLHVLSLSEWTAPINFSQVHPGKTLYVYVYFPELTYMANGNPIRLAIRDKNGITYMTDAMTSSGVPTASSR